MTIIDKILLELCAKDVVEDGMPDFTNEKHLLALNEVLVELNWPMDARGELLYTLMEAEKTSFVGITKDKKRRYFKDKEALDKAVDAGSVTLPDDKEQEKDDDEKQSSDTKVTDFERPGSEKEDEPKDEPQEEPKEKVVDRSNFDKQTSQPVDAKGKGKPRAKGVPKADYPSTQEVLNSMNEGDLSVLKKDEEERRIDRDNGNAGAGGAIASKGESMYGDIVTNYNEDDLDKDEVERVKEEKKNGKYLTEDKKILKALGYGDGPDYPDEAHDYMAKREVWAQQECDRMKSLPKQNVYTKGGKNGFGGDENDGSCNKDFLEWARTAYDGGMETRRLMEDAEDFDETQDNVCVQSEPKTDDAVEAHLEDELKKAEQEGRTEDVEYYKLELANFKKNRKYHDTYIVGKTKDGKTSIISVSNKKGSNMKDPQNNTTPRARFGVIKTGLGTEVAQEVTETLDEAIETVSEVLNVTRKETGNLQNPSDLQEYTKNAISNKRRKELCKKGNQTSGRGSSLGRWLQENEPGVNWDDVCNGKDDGKLLEIIGKYNKDEEWHAQKGNGTPAYDPFSKVFIKIGEEVKQKNLTQWKRDNPGRSVDDYNKERKAELESKSDLTDEERCELMKLREQEAVNESHASVLKSLDEADKGNPNTRPDNPNGENGPHARGYIRSVMGALHFDRYITMDDKSAQKMIVQMGIHGAKPTDIRDCLAKLSGYDLENGSPEGLQEHLEKNATLDQSKTPPAIVISGPDGENSLMEDTWRTAGTSQKVASGFGQSMRDCITDKANERRAGK